MIQKLIVGMTTTGHFHVWQGEEGLSGLRTLDFQVIAMRASHLATATFPWPGSQAINN